MLEQRRKKDKRKDKRIELEFEVKYQPIKFQNWYTTVIKGLGTGGVCLISMEYLGIGSIINIQLPLPNSRTTLTVTGKVLWSDFLFDRKLYESGIKFVKINYDDKVSISRHIDNFIHHHKNQNQLIFKYS